MFVLSRISNYYKLLILLIIFLAFSSSLIGQKQLPKDFCIDKNEINLFDMINVLRVDYSKPELQLSASLSYVADLHVNDLQNNNPDTSICNLSSWSDKGDWTPCCYTKYLHNPDCMWDKPKELTPYPYRGYELVTFFEEGINTDSIINLWSNSKEVLDMILTRGSYAKKKWICAGIGINDNYVSLWFGQRKDNLKKPNICDTIDDITDTIPTSIATNKTNSYYLIFGSYKDMHEAKSERKRIKDDGFKNCDILANDNKHRVYLNKFNSMKEAMFAKQQLPFKYKGAWILKD